MDKLATGKSIETAWQIVARLKEATVTWPPPNKFVLVLPDLEKVEVWSWSPQRPADLKALREIVSDFVQRK